MDIEIYGVLILDCWFCCRYCTGGIRCEMASAYVKSKGFGFENVFQVLSCKREFCFYVFQLLGALMIIIMITVLYYFASLQLFGGIQRYLEQFPDGGYFKGKNFVFDHRYEFLFPNNSCCSKLMSQIDVWALHPWIYSPEYSNSNFWKHICFIFIVCISNIIWKLRFSILLHIWDELSPNQLKRKVASLYIAVVCLGDR